MTEQHEPERPGPEQNGPGQTGPEQTDIPHTETAQAGPEHTDTAQTGHGHTGTEERATPDAAEENSTEQPSTEQPSTEQPSTEQPGTEERTGVRRESWGCSGPAELDLSVEVGRIEVALTDNAADVSVELRADEQSGWAKGLSGLLNWLGEATGPTGSIRIGDKHLNIGGHEFSFGGRDFPFGGLGEWFERAGWRGGWDRGAWDRAGWTGGGEFDLGDLAGRDLPSDAVAAAEITWDEGARRLLVRSPTALPLRLLPVTARVTAPAGSRLTLRTGGGGVTVTGRAGSATVRTGSGDITLDAVDGDVVLTTGSGTAAVGPVAGSTRAKSGSGDLSLASVAGPTQVTTGSGDVRLGVVRADLLAKTGSGDLTVADAESGELRLTTGSGDLHVGVHAGVAAMLDLTSGSGRARSELSVSDTAPVGEGGRVTVHGRTGSGDVLVTRALSATAAG